MVEKSPNAFRTISEVSDALEVPAHVLRFWESKFSQIKPVKRGGGRRYYRPTDLDLIRGIRDLLYSDGLTIKGVQKVLREKGVRHVMEVGAAGDGDGVEIDEATLWDEPDGQSLEIGAAPAPRERALFEMAEAAAPAPKAPEPNPEIRVSAKPKVVSDYAPEREPEIRSLFDDPPSEDKPEPVAAALAKGRPEEVSIAAPAPAEPNARKDEIKKVIGKLESLRERMRSR